MKRRIFLKGALAGGTIAAAAAVGLLRPRAALAAGWPRRAFDAADAAAARVELFGDRSPEASPAVQLLAPVQANGSSVAVEIRAELADVERIALVVPGNPRPLCAVAHTPRAAGYFSSRIRMAEGGEVVAYVQAGDRLYTASAQVKINVGGYGMGRNTR